MEIFSNNPTRTFQIGKRLGKSFKGGEMILLSGDLGSGKTALTKGIAAGLKIKEPILSPTFTIMNEYQGRLKFYHYDAYRLESVGEAEEAGLTQFFANCDAVCVIEWPENIKDAFYGFKTVNILIENLGETNRRLVIA